jgi:hypothetical protein
MRLCLVSVAFFPQGKSLVNAKAVLFVNDDQAQPVKYHFILEQGMSADHNIR